MEKHYAIGIDLGGTSLRVALVTEEGSITKKVKVPSSENLVESLLNSIGEVFMDGVVGIGIGVAGLIDRETGTVSVSPNLPAVDGLNIAGTVKDKFNVPVFIENDANAAALGERWIGEGKGFSNFVLLTLGTGIGGGIIYNSRLMAVAAEIGHMSIIANGEKCPCGNYGCLESYASARAIVSYAIAGLESGSESVLRECCKGNIYKLTPEDIYRAALDGDSLSRDVLKEAGRYLGVGISNLINILSPDAVILTGGLIGAWNIYVQEAIKEAGRRTFKQLFDRVKIIPSSLGDNAGIAGSAYLVFERCQRT
ncbi:MAG: ROK family protein [Thermodesulfovibrionales bacterium]